MLDKKLWPTNNLTPEQATKKLVSTYDLSEVVVFGKTQIFFKTQRTIFRLEAERQKKLPYIVRVSIHQALLIITISKQAGSCCLAIASSLRPLPVRSLLGTRPACTVIFNSFVAMCTVSTIS